MGTCLTVPWALFLLWGTRAAPGPQETRRSPCRHARRFTHLYKRSPSDTLLETGFPAKGAISSLPVRSGGKPQSPELRRRMHAEFVPIAEMRTWSLDEAEPRMPGFFPPPGFLSAPLSGLFTHCN